MEAGSEQPIFGVLLINSSICTFFRELLRGIILGGENGLHDEDELLGERHGTGKKGGLIIRVI